MIRKELQNEVNLSKSASENPVSPRFFGEAQFFHAPVNLGLSARKSDEKLKKMYKRIFK